MTIVTNEIQSLFTERGHVPFHWEKNKAAYKIRRDAVVYVNLASTSGVIALIVPPNIDSEVLRDVVSGLKRGDSNYRSSNMKTIPRRMHRGANPIP